MPKLNVIYLLSITLLLISCGGDGEPIQSGISQPITLDISCDNNDELQGCWIPTDCDLVGSSGGNLTYGRNVYGFTEAGVLQLETRLFDSPDCSTGILSSDLSTTSIPYRVGLTTTADDGTAAQELFVTLDDEFGIPTEYSFIFALLTTDTLCTTDNIQLLPTALVLDPGAERLTLNYENCLIRFEP